MRELHRKLSLPWLCCGDFNEILFNHEKEGGPPRAERCMEKFRQALEDCELQDLGFVGDAFTWRNHHHDANRYTKERLDRAVANVMWRSRYPLVRVTNGDPRHSDHRPVIVDVGDRVSKRWCQPMDVMRKFEARWLEEEECNARVEQSWWRAMEEGELCMVEVQKRMLSDLWIWDREVLGEMERRIKNSKRELERCRRRGINQEQVNREHILRYKLERLQDQHHVYWKQRAHTAWLLKGDRNTKFFHAYASERKRKNLVKKLRDDGGGIVEGRHLKHFIANQYQIFFYLRQVTVKVMLFIVFSAVSHRRLMKLY